MTKIPQGKSGATCKARAGKPAADRRPPPPQPEPRPAYSRPWVAALVKDAIDTADLGGAARRAGVSLQEISRARADDPAIDAALAEVDQSLRLAATAAVIAQAAAGNLRAIKALTDGTLARLDQSFEIGRAHV